MSDTDDYLKTIADGVRHQQARDERRERDADLQSAANRERADQALTHLEHFSEMDPGAGLESDTVLAVVFAGPMLQGGVAVAFASDAAAEAWRTLIQLAKQAYGAGGFMPGVLDTPDVAIPYRDPVSGERGVIYGRTLAAAVALCPRPALDPIGTAIIVPR